MPKNKNNYYVEKMIVNGKLTSIKKKFFDSFSVKSSGGLGITEISCQIELEPNDYSFQCFITSPNKI